MLMTDYSPASRNIIQTTRSKIGNTLVKRVANITVSGNNADREISLHRFSYFAAVFCLFKHV